MNRNREDVGIYLTEKQVSQLFGLSVSWLQNQRWMKRGIPYLKVGRKVLYKKSDVEAWLEKHRVKVTEQ
ncbi:hypothetical protein JCM13304A_09360 [Desulfothermus okinawensis JCM 13304]